MIREVRPLGTHLNSIKHNSLPCYGFSVLTNSSILYPNPITLPCSSAPNPELGFLLLSLNLCIHSIVDHCVCCSFFEKAHIISLLNRRKREDLAKTKPGKDLDSYTIKGTNKIVRGIFLLLLSFSMISGPNA